MFWNINKVDFWGIILSYLHVLVFNTPPPLFFWGRMQDTWHKCKFRLNCIIISIVYLYWFLFYRVFKFLKSCPKTLWTMFITHLSLGEKSWVFFEGGLFICFLVCLLFVCLSHSIILVVLYKLSWWYICISACNIIGYKYNWYVHSCLLTTMTFFAYWLQGYKRLRLDF
jgi:hypothetical protein